MEKKEVKHLIQQLVKQQRFAVIATETNRQPYTNLVAFAATSDLRVLVFATRRDTKKYLNLNENNRIAVLIDNRENTPADLSDARTVTALGVAHESKEKKEIYRTLLLQKHPTLSDFLNDPTCALIEIRVQTYQMIQQFEQMQLLHIRDVDT
jgi:nitroimidazol reductase NimA-like FMN-containing flavoprotein (pyridoxamine 5'-phosphate oxidase superfamily)